MKNLNKTIGSFEAKTHLSSLIEDVQNGRDYIITKRGKPVARLVPYKDKENDYEMVEAISSFREIRNSIKGKVDIRSYIDEGRKY